MTVRVAVVDGDVEILDAMQLLLEQEGWAIRTYLTGTALLADKDNFQPACIVLDPDLPDVAEEGFVYAITNVSTHISIVGLTAAPASSTVGLLMKAGAQVVLTKPVSGDALIQHIQRALSEAKL